MIRAALFMLAVLATLLTVSYQVSVRIFQNRDL